MQIGGLSLFTRTSSRRCFGIAAYHSPHSLTWSWQVSVTLDGIWRKPNGWLRLGLHAMKHNAGREAYLTLPHLSFHASTQREMWFRDLWRSERDRREGEEQMAWRNMAARAEAQVLAAMPVEGGVQ